MKKLLIVLIITMIGAAAIAQTKFNGTVSFNVEYKGDGVAAFASMLPNKQLYHYGNGNFKMETTGGMMGGQADVLYLAKENKTYVISVPSKKAQEISASDDKKSNITITETGEKVDILGYSCDKYKVVIVSEQGTMTQYIWAAKALQPIMPKNVDNMEALAAFTDKIKGLPLKIELEVKQNGMGFTMVMTATNIKEGDPGSIFAIPAGYTVEAFDPKKIGR